AAVAVDARGGWPSPRRVIAVGHRPGDELVRYDERARRAATLGLEARERLYQRREIGARVAEEHVDAAVLQQLEVGLRRRLRLESPRAHERTSCGWNALRQKHDAARALPVDHEPVHAGRVAQRKALGHRRAELALAHQLDDVGELGA